MAHCRIKPGVICLAFFQPPTPGNGGRSTTSAGLRFDNTARALPHLLRARSLSRGLSTMRPDRSIGQQPATKQKPKTAPCIDGAYSTGRDVYVRTGSIIIKRTRWRRTRYNIAYKFTRNRRYVARLSFPELLRWEASPAKMRIRTAKSLSEVSEANSSASYPARGQCRSFVSSTFGPDADERLFAATILYPERSIVWFDRFIELTFLFFFLIDGR